MEKTKAPEPQVINPGTMVRLGEFLVQINLSGELVVWKDSQETGNLSLRIQPVLEEMKVASDGKIRLSTTTLGFPCFVVSKE